MSASGFDPMDGTHPSLPEGATTLGRRPFMQLFLSGMGALSLSSRHATAKERFRVGVGRSMDPYAATWAAVTASGEWPAARIAGREVVIKVNLVGALPSESGATTSPDAVRALVDLALGAEASRVSIIENGVLGAPFSRCGYDIFVGYDPRVALVDLRAEGHVPTPVPGGTAYRGLYLSETAARPGSVLISAAKLKTHLEGGASLSLKNLFGLPPIPPYLIWDAYTGTGPLASRPRNFLHQRAMSQTVVDLALARPIDFAVVDGVWGMEGAGPVLGTPVLAGLVVAGQNPVAVDRVCLDAMGIPQDRPQHLTYATWKGLGPGSLGPIDRVGGHYDPFAFEEPLLPPPVWHARARPGSIAAASGERAALSYRLDRASQTRLQVLRTSDFPPTHTVVRTLRDWTFRPAGIETLVWDGRDDAGRLVPPGPYALRSQARFGGEDAVPANAIGWVGVR